jgi:amino acid permease
MDVPQESTMIYLQILRVIAVIAFIAGGNWLAFYHHHDSTFVQNLTVIIPFITIGLSNYLISRARKNPA